MKIIIGLKLTLWIIAISGSYLIFPLWFIWSGPEMFILILGGIYPIAVFIYSIRYIRNIKEILYFLILIPSIDTIDSIAFLVGIRQKGFVVIDKD